MLTTFNPKPWWPGCAPLPAPDGQRVFGHTLTCACHWCRYLRDKEKVTRPSRFAWSAAAADHPRLTRRTA